MIGSGTGISGEVESRGNYLPMGPLPFGLFPSRAAQAGRGGRRVPEPLILHVSRFESGLKTVTSRRRPRFEAEGWTSF